MDSNDKSLERRLEAAFRIEPPASLHPRLLAIADEAPAPQPHRSGESAPRRGVLAWAGIDRILDFQWRLAVPAFAVAAAVAVVWVAGTRVAPEAPLVADTEDMTAIEQQEAIRDFVIVMSYLQAATASAHRGVQEEIGTGLMTAFNRGEQSFTEMSNELTNGG